MKRALAALAILTTIVGCSASAQRSEENFVAATEDLPATPRALLTIGDFVCEELPTTPAARLASDLSGELFTIEQASTLVDAASEHLCP